MTRPRCTTVLRRFLDGESIADLAGRCWMGGMDHRDAFLYVEHCIRRGLRGEVQIPEPSKRTRQ